MGFHSSKTRQAWSIPQADLSTLRGALQSRVNFVRRLTSRSGSSTTSILIAAPNGSPIRSPPSPGIGRESRLPSARAVPDCGSRRMDTKKGHARPIDLACRSAWFPIDVASITGIHWRHGCPICSGAPRGQVPKPHRGAPRARDLTAKAQVQLQPIRRQTGGPR